MLPSTKKALTFTFNSVFLLLVELPTLNTPKTIQLKIKQVRKLDYTSQDWLQNVDILKRIHIANTIPYLPNPLINKKLELYSAQVPLFSTKPRVEW